MRLAVHEHRRAEQHADVEHGVDARLRGEEAHREGADPLAAPDGQRRPARPPPATIASTPKPLRTRDDHRERINAAEEEQHAAPAAIGAAEDQETGAERRRCRHSRRWRSPPARRARRRARGRRGRWCRGRSPGGRAGAGDQHEQRMRRLVDPGGEDLERVEHYPAVGDVPQDQRAEKREHEMPTGPVASRAAPRR